MAVSTLNLPQSTCATIQIDDETLTINYTYDDDDEKQLQTSHLSSAVSTEIISYIPQSHIDNFMVYFDKLDRKKKGFLCASDVCIFFRESGLNESILAQVWDLSDIDTECGTVSSSKFCVAMHLINCVRQGALLPNALPPFLSKDTASYIGSLDMNWLINDDNYESQMITSDLLLFYGFMREYQNNIYVPNDIVNRCFQFFRTVHYKYFENGYNTAKWYLNYNYRTIKALDSELLVDGRYYCVYLDIYDKRNIDDDNVYYCSILFRNRRYYQAFCYIGITSIRNNKWITDGLTSSEWEDIADYSYLYALIDKHLWIDGESVTVKVDLNDFVIYFYKTNKDKEVILLRTQSIKRAPHYYFMICARPYHQDSYTIEDFH